MLGLCVFLIRKGQVVNKVIGFLIMLVNRYFLSQITTDRIMYSIFIILCIIFGRDKNKGLYINDNKINFCWGNSEYPWVYVSGEFLPELPSGNSN